MKDHPPAFRMPFLYDERFTEVKERAYSELEMEATGLAADAGTPRSVARRRGCSPPAPFAFAITKAEHVRSLTLERSR